MTNIRLTPKLVELVKGFVQPYYSIGKISRDEFKAMVRAVVKELSMHELMPPEDAIRLCVVRHVQKSEKAPMK